MATDKTEIGALGQATAEEIRVWMTRRRISGARLAAELGVSAAWISYRINGQVDIGLTDLERIARVLGVEVAELLPRPATSDERPEGRIKERYSTPPHPVDVTSPRPAPRTPPTDRPPARSVLGPRSRPSWTHEGAAT